ncbi:MAG: hypothetical protein J07HQW2_03728 [Haloquadratum walsbyi J07HQW2]|uniref:Uncharacterized protein n=1 Tax=Haloquadratum walsbyi J07HQW2 TaxID=1238425 RepID=U1PTV2_9EURY|nr:MAG: hypothetical protein J07HQW2_03728 [Haloquadratum walsbyi J07HQW2]
MPETQAIVTLSADYTKLFSSALNSVSSPRGSTELIELGCSLISLIPNRLGADHNIRPDCAKTPPPLCIPEYAWASATNDYLNACVYAY